MVRLGIIGNHRRRLFAEPHGTSLRWTQFTAETIKNPAAINSHHAARDGLGNEDYHTRGVAAARSHDGPTTTTTTR